MLSGEPRSRYYRPGSPEGVAASVDVWEPGAASVFVWKSAQPSQRRQKELAPVKVARDGCHENDHEHQNRLRYSPKSRQCRPGSAP